MRTNLITLDAIHLLSFYYVVVLGSRWSLAQASWGSYIHPSISLSGIMVSILWCVCLCVCVVLSLAQSCTEPSQCTYIWLRIGLIANRCSDWDEDESLAIKRKFLFGSSCNSSQKKGVFRFRSSMFPTSAAFASSHGWILWPNVLDALHSTLYWRILKSIEPSDIPFNYQITPNNFDANTFSQADVCLHLICIEHHWPMQIHREHNTKWSVEMRRMRCWR